jgi:hypothetical protein
MCSISLRSLRKPFSKATAKFREVAKEPIRREFSHTSHGRCEPAEHCVEANYRNGFLQPAPMW